MSNDNPTYLDGLLNKQVSSAGVVAPTRPTLNFTNATVTDNPTNPNGPSTDVTLNANAGGQQTNILANGLNSNVPTNGLSSLRFGSYTAAVSLGGLVTPSPPVGGQTIDMLFIVSGNKPVTIVNGDASSTPGYRIATPTGQNLLLPVGQAVQARVVYDGSSNVWVFQLSSVEQVNEINVKNFGAAGDGVTDDTAAIQAAINACIASGYIAAAIFGWRLYFPAGTYLVSSTLTQNGADGLTWEGVGGLSQIVWVGGSSATPMIVVENCYRPAFEHLFFTCRTPLLSVIDMNTTSGGNFINTRGHFQDCIFISGADLGGGTAANAIFEYGVRVGTAGLNDNNDFHSFDHCTVTGYGQAALILNNSNVWQVLCKQCAFVGAIASIGVTFSVGSNTVTVPLTSGEPSFTTAKDGPTTINGNAIPGKTIEVTDGTNWARTTVVSVATSGGSSVITVAASGLTGLSGSSGTLYYGSQAIVWSSTTNPGGGTFSYENGAGGNSLLADFVLGSQGGGSFKIADFDSEGSRCFLTTVGVSAAVQKLVLLEDVYWDNTGMNAANTHMVEFLWGGTLKALNCQFGTTPSGAWDVYLIQSVTPTTAQTSFENCLFYTTLTDTFTPATGLFYFSQPTDRRNCRIVNGGGSVLLADITKNEQVAQPIAIAPVIVANEHRNRWAVRTTNNTPVVVASIPLPGTAGADYALGGFTIEAQAVMFDATTGAQVATIRLLWGWAVVTPGSPVAQGAALQTLLSIGTTTGAPPVGWAFVIALDGTSKYAQLVVTGDAADTVDTIVTGKWWFSA
jgi:hypothetical protein